MPEFFTILIKVNIALVLFCLGYYLVLRKLTFYTLNRTYLVTAIIFSSVYPFVDLSALAQRHQEFVAPVQEVVVYWKAPAENLIKETSYWNWLEMLFWAGAIVFTVRLAFQLISLYKIYKRSTAREINGQSVRVVQGDISPFSFWQSIYINPENLSPTDLQNILEHEQIHVKEWHTLDVLLTEVSVIFYWFNPGIWMMKKAVRENIEFITDRKILRKGADSKAYQYSLLNITFNQPAPAITSNFNFSTLKKRIMMMNAKKSSNLNLTRYAFLMPAVAICLFVFSLTKAEAVKASPAFKAVADVVADIKEIALAADTTPVNNTKQTQSKAVDGTNKVVIAPVDLSLQNKETQQPGLVAGTVTTNNENKQLTIRGGNPKDSTIIIVDGKIVQNINTIDPNIIETVTVLKESGSWEYVKTVTGVSLPADVKIAGMIVITTRPGANQNIAIKPGFNGVNVIGYGANIKPVQIDSAATTNLITRLKRTSTNDPNRPLVIIDGKEFTSSLDKINADSIQSVSILKDASAVAMYGDKGKNGVIIIHTKQTSN